MRTTILGRSAAGLFTLMLVLGGCGGSDPETAASAPALGRSLAARGCCTANPKFLLVLRQK